MPLGKITGLIVGCSVAYFFILPGDLLHTLRTTPLSLVPLADIVRVLASLAITIVSAALGHFLDRR
jgi:hypothetical protein